MTDTAKGFTLKGWHVLAGFVAAFGIIITVNLTLAFNAVRTFPGLEVKNSYVASQTFDDRRAAQQALGWTATAAASATELTLRITDTAGAPVMVGDLQATLGRATHVQDDMTPAFAYRNGTYHAPATLAPGNWNLRMTAIAADGTPFAQRIVLHVPE